MTACKDQKNNFIAGNGGLVSQAKEDRTVPTKPFPPPVHLSPVPPQALIELICNVQAMEDAVVEMKYDTKKAPLGELV